MEHLESFRNMAELGLTIIGFSALISIFQRSKTDWNHMNKVNLIRFYAMLEQGVVLLFGCYLPVILINYVDSEMTFRICSGIVGCSAMGYAFITARRNKKITGQINVIKYITAMLWAAAIIYICISFLNAMAFLGKDFASNYLLIMFIQMFFAIFLFMRLIYFSVQPPTDKP